MKNKKEKVRKIHISWKQIITFTISILLVIAMFILSILKIIEWMRW